jgi:hypothetical protein
MKPTREDLYQQVDLILELEAEQTSVLPHEDKDRQQRLYASAALYAVCASLLEVDRIHYGKPAMAEPDAVEAVQACTIESQLRLVASMLVRSAFGGRSGRVDGTERMRQLGGTLDSLTHLKDLQGATDRVEPG